MTAPLRLALSPLEDRRGVPLARAAEILAVEEPTVRKLLDTGKLKGFRVGRRIRVYEASITAYQDQSALGTHSPTPEPPKPPRQRRTSAEHRESLALLAQLGV